MVARSWGLRGCRRGLSVGARRVHRLVSGASALLTTCLPLPGLRKRAAPERTILACLLSLRRTLPGVRRCGADPPVALRLAL